MSLKEKSMERGNKKCLKNKSQKFSNVGEKHKVTNSTLGRFNSRQNKHKENHVKQRYSQTTKY